MDIIRPISRILAALLLFGLASSCGYAKDIKLGGEQKVTIPPTMIVLPTIRVMIRGQDGGWAHIKINAWLAGTDEEDARRLQSLKGAIVAKADHEFSKRDFDTLRSAERGSAEAKRVIHAAVETGLGQAWKGEVLIQNMLVY